MTDAGERIDARSTGVVPAQHPTAAPGSTHRPTFVGGVEHRWGVGSMAGMAGSRQPARATVILGVAASDAHVVANHLIAFQLRQLDYDVVNLGACTPVAEFVRAFAAHPAAIAVVIGSINGHAVEDLTPLRAAKDQGQLPCPVIVGGNLSVGSAKTGREADVLRRLGADHVLAEVDELVDLLGELRQAAELRSTYRVPAVPAARRHARLATVA